MRKHFTKPAHGEWLLNWRQLSAYSFGGMIGSGDLSPVVVVDGVLSRAREGGQAVTVGEAVLVTR
jgi:hypothetical protein